jgi:AmmeMemoRadiSam system protein B/AmmeMemoRadiSam system protein A
MEKKDMKIFINLVIIIIVVFSNASATTKRPAAVAGSFYPADSAELAKMVNQHLDAVRDLPEIDGQIIALVVPHAGLVYSGGIAAHAYKLLENKPIEKVILCGPSHHYPFRGLSVYGPYIAWTMPFGTVKCHDKLGVEIYNFHENIKFLPEPHFKEHSLEVQLPYLKTVLNNFKIVPIAMGYQEASTINLLADALKSLDFDSTMIMIASTDWQHFHSAEKGWLKDSLGIWCLENMNPNALQRYLNNKKVEMCGGGTTVAVLKAAMAHGANKVKILKYGDSGDISGDKSSVVGYVAAVIYKSNDSEKSEPKGKSQSAKEDNLPDKFELSGDDKNLLLKIARQSITEYLQNGKIPDFDVPENLQNQGAGFVTLEKNDQLRGCIGYTTAVEPLYKTVSQCAIKAAVADRRFLPVQLEEMGDIHIEISVLTPLQKINSLDEIEVGRDGLMIFKGNHRGLLLPQVATDYGWDRKTFLEQTCQKAGLPPDSYMDEDVDIFKFQAVIFEE